MAELPSPSRGRGLVDTKAELVLRYTLEVRRQMYRIAQQQRRERVQVHAKQLNYVKVKNEGKNVIQTELDASEVQNCHAKPIVLTKM